MLVVLFGTEEKSGLRYKGSFLEAAVILEGGESLGPSRVLAQGIQCFVQPGVEGVLEASGA